MPSYKILKTKIKQLAPRHRPREKLWQFGAKNLTDAELLAVIIGSGMKQHSALKIAHHLVNKSSFKKLASFSLKQLCEMRGIGLVNASKIQVIFELAKRFNHKTSLSKLDSPEKVFQEVKEFSKKKQEHTIALYLNGRLELIKKKVIAIGGQNSNLIEARDIFAPALTLPAQFVILVHNHPSGDSHPSADDINVTLKLKKAAEILGVKLIDHLVITQNQYSSICSKNNNSL